MEKKNKNKGGRPTDYTNELATLICARIANGESLRRICEEEKMPHRSTVHLWLLDPAKQQFFDQYEKACNTRAENMFDDLLEIADDGSNDWMERETKDGKSFTVLDHENVQRSRLRVDTRKWYLSKVLPKKFGDKMDVTSDGKPIPLLNVLHNDSHEEDTSTQEEN